MTIHDTDIAIVGAGATGVELAAELHHAAKQLAAYGLNRIRPEDMRITLIEAGPRVLPALPERIARPLHKTLEKLGVTPSELMRQALQYVAERGQLPFRPVLMTEEDEALIATVRERLAAPQRVKVALDDL